MHDQAPARVRSLALLSAYAGWKGSLEPADVAQRLAACLAPRGPVHPDEAAAFVGPDAPADLLEEVMALEVGTTALGAAVQGRAFAEADLRAVLPTLRVPTLVVRGEHDARCPAPVTQAIAAAVPGSRLVVVAGVGHCLDLEAPSEVNRLLLGHVRAAERSARSQ
jgi:pimeloyl-ACP methyl ester carboxylesterase